MAEVASPFDAYLARDGQVHWLGRPDEVFQFKKCMDQRGFPIR
jgi:hypothetical protein